MGSVDEPLDTSPVLLGAPFDGTTSFMPGARFGPRRIREVSDGLESYSPTLRRDLEELRFADLGDLELPFGNPPKALELIEDALRPIYQAGRLPVMLGGEHTVTLAGVRAALATHPDLIIIQFDAHADLREEYCGESVSHATVMRRITEILGGERVYQFGIRSGTREEFEFGREQTRFFPGNGLEGVLRAATEELGERPVYLTVDIDVVDPAFAPGTGTPEPGGWTSSELFDALLAIRDLNVIGCDLVEVCPAAEHGIVTSILGAKVVREMLLAFGLPQGLARGEKA